LSNIKEINKKMNYYVYSTMIEENPTNNDITIVVCAENVEQAIEKIRDDLENRGEQESKVVEELLNKYPQPDEVHELDNVLYFYKD